MTDKKVSVKFYLNTKLKPKERFGGKFYPVYVRVTYDRKNTTFKYNHLLTNQPLLMSEKEKPYLLEGRFYGKVLNEMKETILNIVSYEINRFKSNFSLAGLSDRIRCYYSPINLIFINLAKDGIKSIVDNHLTVKEYESVLKIDDIPLKLKQIKDFLPKEIFSEIFDLRDLQTNYSTINDLEDFVFFENKGVDKFNILLHFFLTEYKKEITPYNWVINNDRNTFKVFIEAKYREFKTTGKILIFSEIQCISGYVSDILFKPKALVGFIDDMITSAITGEPHELFFPKIKR
ncbi:MAG: hypothetical protein ACPGXZ_16310 [Saprospiraceae bacterium]